jgi:hypothetical protein
MARRTWCQVHLTLCEHRFTFTQGHASLDRSWHVIRRENATIGLAIAAHIVIAAPDDAGKRDQRDKDIKGYGEYVGGLVLSVAAVVSLILALAEVDHFWIADAIYLAFILAATAGSIVKIVAYRRGF